MGLVDLVDDWLLGAREDFLDDLWDNWLVEPCEASTCFECS